MPPAIQSTFWCLFTPGLLSRNTKDWGMREESIHLDPNPSWSLRHSQKQPVSYLALLPSVCCSARTKEVPSMLLSHLRYLSYLKSSKGENSHFFVPYSLLREEEGGSKVPFSSVGTDTEVIPAHQNPHVRNTFAL